MNKLYFAALAAVALSFTACKTKPTVLQFASPEANMAVQHGDKLDVKLNFGSLDMDSVVYFLDYKSIGTKQDTTALSVNTSDFSFGSKVLSAYVYKGGKADSSSTTVYIVPPAAKNYGFEVVNTFPHDTTSFTQGLEYADGIFYESAGRYGESNIRKVEPKTGKVLKRQDLDEKTFAEGLTLLGDKLILLTWQQKEGYVFNKNTFAKESTFQYQNSAEGWGLTHDCTRLIKSDGTNKLYFLDPKSLQETSSV